MRKLTRTEANFENLLEAALLVEGHCSHAKHGCCCRGCDECEENYMMESEEGEKESLADLIGKYVEGEGKPNTDVPYGDDPRADDEDNGGYDEEQEGMIDPVNTAIGLLTKKDQIQASPQSVRSILDPAVEKARRMLTKLAGGLGKY